MLAARYSGTRYIYKLTNYTQWTFINQHANSSLSGLPYLTHKRLKQTAKPRWGRDRQRKEESKEMLMYTAYPCKSLVNKMPCSQKQRSNLCSEVPKHFISANIKSDATSLSAYGMFRSSIFFFLGFQSPLLLRTCTVRLKWDTFSLSQSTSILPASWNAVNSHTTEAVNAPSKPKTSI
jgi:hypothetical protein